jgi:CubicO group peptidase (beta-lactamase class C family)
VFAKKSTWAQICPQERNTTRRVNLLELNYVVFTMNETFSGTPVLINRRSLLLWSGSLLAAIAAQKAQLLASSATGKNAPSADADNLEHVFDLSPSSWKTWIKEVETLIPKVMRETSVPGCSVVLIRDARIYWHRGFGVRDAETRQPVDNGTVFEAASASKPVFAYVVIKLAEKGVIDLEAPLTKYTNEGYVANDPRLDLITARHVLMHATGFPNWRSADNPMAINFTPGSKFGYSGEAYSYLQSVITKLTGHVDNSRCGEFESGARFCATDIADFMQKRLLRPFHMDSSSYVWNEQLAKNLARPHGEQGEPQPFHKPAALDASRYAAAGGLITTPTDYAKFLIELIQPSPADEFHVSKRSHDEMIRPQFPFQDFDGYSVSWGLLGCRIVRMSQHQLIAPGGSNPGFQCYSAVSPSRKSGFVIMTNADSGLNLLTKLTPSILGGS